ncbi:hypothetical protein C8R47DRAFT_1157247 [Mycena vitilis]|nr:hypothetical protein C8R47DRAFT_1157247 [Mycena vitilis]
MPALLSGNPWCVRSKTQKRSMALQLESCSSDSRALVDIPVGSAPLDPFSPLLAPSIALTRVLSSTHLAPQPVTRTPSVSFASPTLGPSAVHVQLQTDVHPVPAESCDLVGRTRVGSNDQISDKLKIFCSVDRGQATRIALREACTRLRETHCEWADCSAVLNSSQTLAIHLKAVHFEDEGKPLLPLTLWSCLWAKCSESFETGGRCRRHVVERHVFGALRCEYQSCDMVFEDPSTLVAHATRHIKDKNTLRPSIYPSLALDLALPANVIKPRESYRPVVNVNPSFSPTTICESRHRFPKAAQLENWRSGPFQRSRPAPAKLARQMSDLKDDTDLTDVVLWPPGGVGAQQPVFHCVVRVG